MIYSYILSRGCFWFTFKGIQKDIDFVKHFANKKMFWAFFCNRLGSDQRTDCCFTTQTYFIHIKKHVIQLRTA